MVSRLQRSSVQWALFCCLITSGPAWGQVPQDGNPGKDEVAGAKDVPALIADLGATQFATRESAQRQLIAVGHPALAAVEQATGHPDPEIQRRATATLELLKEAILHQDLARLRAGEDVKLPGWDRFRKTIGESEADRHLFAEILLAEWELVELTESSPHRMDYEIFRRAAQLKFQIYGEDQTVQIGNIAALLFAASHPDVNLTGLANEELHILLSMPALSESLVSHAASSSLRNVVNRWILRTIENRYISGRIRHSILTFCLQENLESGVPLAISVLRSSGGDFFDADRNTFMVFAMLAIGKLGNEEHRPILQEFFDRRHRIVQYLHEPDQETFSTQLRDAALVVDIHLAGEDPRQFGFDQLSPDHTHLYAYRTIGFPTEQSREDAFQKWAKFREKQSAQPVEEKIEAEHPGS
jgi:hypothetical protein